MECHHENSYHDHDDHHHDRHGHGHDQQQNQQARMRPPAASDAPDSSDSCLFQLHHQHHQRRQGLDTTGYWLFNDDQKNKHRSKTICFDGEDLAASECSMGEPAAPDFCILVEDEEETMLHHDFIKLLVEQPHLDQTLHYLIQEEEVEVIKSCDGVCDYGDYVAKLGFNLSHVELPSGNASKLHESKDHGISKNEEIDRGSNWSPDIYNNLDHQSMFSNISSIDNTGDSSIHTIGANFHEVGRLCYVNIGHELIQIMRCMSVKDRRPLMSIVVEYVSKHDMELLLGSTITSYEWSMARKHRKYPGPGRSVNTKQQFFRKRVKEAVISEFVEWLHASDMLQSLSYGHKVVKYCNGYHVPVEAVKRNKTMSTIIRQYIEFWNDARAPTQDSDESSCNDTVKDDAIDDEQIGDQRCSGMCKKTGARTFHNVDSLMQNISNVAEFHKVGFPRHLGQGVYVEHISFCNHNPISRKHPFILTHNIPR